MLEAFGDADGNHRFAGDESVIFLNQIFQPDFERIEITAPGDVVEVRLIGPADMGGADAAIGAGRRQIGVNRVGGEITMRNVVGSAGDDGGVLGIRRTGERVGAHVVPRVDFARPQAAVAFEAGFDFYHRAEAPAGEKNFVAGENPLHRAARLARQQRDHGSMRAWFLPP